MHIACQIISNIVQQRQIVTFQISIFLHCWRQRFAVCEERQEGGRDQKARLFLDAVVDRIIDICVGVLFVAIGAPLELVILAVSLALIHEYMRARAGGLGYHNSATITVAEKPTRIALGVMFLIASAVFPKSASDLATVATITWIAVGVLGFAQLMRAYRKLLKA